MKNFPYGMIHYFHTICKKEFPLKHKLGHILVLKPPVADPLLRVRV